MIIQVGQIPVPPTAPYDPSRDREIMRGKLAKWLVWTLSGSFVAAFTLGGGGWVSIRDSLALIGALTGVTGTALGFYFGHGPTTK